jgi:YidC/Oxa1 family membrane protein insertase
MGNGNRTWLAVALCCMVWFGYMRWFAPPPMVAPTTTGTTATAPAAGTAPTATAPSAASTTTATSAGAVGSPFATKATLSDTESGRLSSPAREVFLNEMGGKIASIRLLDFTQTLKKDSPKIESLDPVSMPHTFATLFTQAALAEFGFAQYAKKESGGQTVFEKQLGGVHVTKTYAPGDGDYFFSEQVNIKLPAGDKKDFGFLIVPVGGVGLVPHAEDPLRAWDAVSFQNESLVRKKMEDIKEGSEVLQGNTKWVAFGNRYFSNTVVNESSINPDVVFEKNADFSGVYLRFPLIAKADAHEIFLRFKIYSGPKEYSELARVPGLRGLIDYGMFSFLAYPLLELLRFFYRFVHNYGLAIILLTLVVRGLFYPLSLKSYKSMKAMQKLQPQITALKEKHKDDAQRFGQEQMALFRAHKVNPAGGCLPILVQLPVFIALYAVLQNSIELFHAPLFGWVQDLSSKDPFYVFPVLMGISMFVQQKMTPAAGMDPMQQKILLLMPVIFSFVMLNLPAGLTMYIFVSTLLGILQQVLMNRGRKDLVPFSAPM